jgi:hypothetical protein
MRVRVTLVATALATAALVLGAVPAMAASNSPSAAQTSAEVVTLPLLVAVRTAHHPGFDRITFEFKGARPDHRVRYVSRLTEDGSGAPVQLAGGATIEVVFQSANAHDDNGKPTVSPRRFSPGLAVLKEVAQIGDFEGVVSYGLGVDHRVPFKVVQLSNPSRVAVDLATGSSSAAGGSTSGSSGSLPFTGSHSGGMLLTALSLALVGALVLALARRTRTP